MSEAEIEIEGQEPPSRVKLAASAAVSIIAVALAFYLLRGHAPEIAQALSDASWYGFLVLVSIMLPAMAVRLTAWDLALKAAGGTAPRRYTWPISLIAGFAGALNPSFSFATRLELFRRLRPPGHIPLSRLFAVDMAMLVLEASLAVGLLVATGWSLALHPLILVGVVAAVIALHWGLHHLSRLHLERIPALEGLTLLRRRHLLIRGAGLMAIVYGLQIGRLWACLAMVGIAVTPFEAALAFVAIGVIGVIPLGPTAGPTALALVFGSQDLAAAVAAGVLYAASGLCALAGLALGAAVWLQVQRRRDRRAACGQIQPSPLPRS